MGGRVLPNASNANRSNERFESEPVQKAQRKHSPPTIQVEEAYQTTAEQKLNGMNKEQQKTILNIPAIGNTLSDLSPRSMPRGASMAALIGGKFVAKLPKDLMENRTKVELEHVRIEDIEGNLEIFAKARYLYWACFRGHNRLIRHILETDKISPFARVYESRSPLMAAIFGK